MLVRGYDEFESIGVEEAVNRAYQAVSAESQESLLYVMLGLFRNRVMTEEEFENFYSGIFGKIRKIVKSPHKAYEVILGKHQEKDGDEKHQVQLPFTQKISPPANLQGLSLRQAGFTIEKD